MGSLHSLIISIEALEKTIKKEKQEVNALKCAHDSVCLHENEYIEYRYETHIPGYAPTYLTNIDLVKHRNDLLTTETSKRMIFGYAACVDMLEFVNMTDDELKIIERIKTDYPRISFTYCAVENLNRRDSRFNINDDVCTCLTVTSSYDYDTYMWVDTDNS